MKTPNQTLKTGIGKQGHRGFTLGQVVIATAIVGTLTAIAVPNYLRIKMNTNMEMVKQQLKKMGTHMNELYNQNHVFPEDILNLGNGLDETSVTASLNAIDSFDYTTDGYTTSANRSYYRFQTCPRTNIAGDRCFILDASGIAEDIALALAAFGVPVPPPAVVPLWSFNLGQAMDFGLFGRDQNRNLRILAAIMEQFAYYTSWKSTMNQGAPATMAHMVYDKNLVIIKEMLPKIVTGLQSKGITMTFFEREGSIQTLALPGMEPITYRSKNDIVVTYELKKPVLTYNDYEKRTAKIK